ncbi:hypothetical protein [Leisingera sp. ANG-M7]|uniref:hypothetical protein n=1 Tax=Leisingera sp. ANG-M7 TaxID=1577902 RepID=UPI00057F486F|nr:hypothetical protein [Leisingera sp. ANG-M7]KIC39393.1 hypothetical protein RA26_01720 [Leisingera sp. ANG-M7]
MTEKCVSCGQPATHNCMADCGMSLCGSPLCDDCHHVHVGGVWGWDHQRRKGAKQPKGHAAPDNKYTCPRCGGTGEEREAVPADQVGAPERIWAYIDEDSDGLYIECLSEDPFSPDDAGTEYLLPAMPATRTGKE